MYPRREHEPGDKGRGPNQHGEGVVIQITGLQTHHVAGDVEHACRHAVRPKTVDQPAIAALPQQAAEPLRGPDEDQVIQLVEVPFIEQEAVKPIVLPRQFDRNVGTADIEVPGDHEANQHHDRR